MDVLSNELTTEMIGSFRELKRTLGRIIEKDADRIGVTMLHLMVMNILRKNADIGLSELADRLQLGSSTMSGVVDRMVKAQLIERGHSTTDRRAIRLKLTEEGTSKLEEAFGEHSQFQRAMRRVLEVPEEDIRSMLRIQTELLNKLKQVEGEQERDGSC